MQVKVNGSLHNFKENITLSEVISQLNINDINIVAEVNGSIITKDKFAATYIEENSCIELVKFVGGG